jgi:hypothetical protein
MDLKLTSTICIYSLIFSILISCSNDPDKPMFNNIFDPLGNYDDNPPEARISVNPDSGIANETEFIFDASASKETENPDAALYFCWDFDNNGIWDTPFDMNPKIKHTFSEGGGDRLVNLLVKGAKGLFSNASSTIFVNTRPYILVTWQEDTENPNLIHFDASNSYDVEDGADLEYRWDFNNDGTWENDWENESQAQYEFSTDQWETKLEIHDSKNLVSSKTLSNSIPVNPLAVYLFNGNANDKSVNGNDGIVHGATLTEDRFGNPNSAYEFDGIDDYIDIGSSSILKPDFPISLSLWVKPKSFENSIGLFRNNKDDTRYYGIFCLIGPSSKVSAGFGDGGYIGPNSRKNKIGETELVKDRWYHIVAIYMDANHIDLYVNGINDGGIYSGEATHLNYSSDSAEIGTIDSRQKKPPYYADAVIDNIYFFDSALNNEEIQILYHDKY